MATTVHLPQDLLDAVDRKAHALRMSRNRLIRRALEREVAGGTEWSPGFLERLRAPEPETIELVDEMLDAIRAGRRSKRPRPL